jgi:hypothetical protein
VVEYLTNFEAAELLRVKVRAFIDIVGRSVRATTPRQAADGVCGRGTVARECRETS